MNDLTVTEAANADAIRKALSSIAPLMARIVETERLQLEEKTARLTDQSRIEERFKLILDAMRDKKFPPQKVFYDGQIYDDYLDGKFIPDILARL